MLVRPIKPVARIIFAIGLGFSIDYVGAESANYTAIETNTAEVVTAVEAFIYTLTDELIGEEQTVCTMDGDGTLLYSYELGLVECWSNLPGGRNGLQFANLTDVQKEAALEVLDVAMSTRGNTMLEEIRASDDYIDATQENSPWGGEKYSIAIYGTPATDSPWMLQISGHHLAFNLTYSGSYVSATPMFIGTEPANWEDDDGVYHAPLEVQRRAFYNLAESLQADTEAAAATELEEIYDDVLMGISNGCDSNYPAEYPTSNRGGLVSELSSVQQRLVRTAISAWTAQLYRPITSLLNQTYTDEDALAETYVAYSVGDSGKADFSEFTDGIETEHSYIRIDGPRVWIEFVVQQGVAFSEQIHYHALWRDKEADYGGEFDSASVLYEGQCGDLASNTEEGGDEDGFGGDQGGFGEGDMTPPDEGGDMAFP